MAFVSVASLIAGGVLAHWMDGRSVAVSPRFELLSGGLLAVGLILLGVGLHSSMS